MKKLLLSIQISLLLASFNAFSQKPDNQIITKFLIEGGAEYGGDEILKIFFDNGEDQSMKAGQGLYLAVGGQLEFLKAKNFMLRASVGIKYTTTAASNANINLTRIPINLMPYWKIKNDFRFGIGITTHQSIKLKGDGLVSDTSFKSSIGPKIEFGYKWVALTYTAINYKTDTIDDFSASSLGLAISFVFPNK